MKNMSNHLTSLLSDITASISSEARLGSMREAGRPETFFVWLAGVVAVTSGTTSDSAVISP